MTKTEVEAMLARAEKATPGMDDLKPINRTEDLEFSRHARTDLPVLARAYTEAMDALQGLRGTATLLGLVEHPVDDFLAAYHAPASTQPAGGSK